MSQSQESQELFLLQILKIPVILIKFAAKVLSISTYLPNYLFLYLIDLVIFSQKLKKSLMIYIISWPLKVICFLLTITLFLIQFYGIYLFLDLQNKGIIIQIIGMTLLISGLLILMRKGYLSLIQKFQLTKIKSVKQHLEIGLYLFIDIISTVLSIINILLIINANKTYKYIYKSQSKFIYIKYIFYLLKVSIIQYIQIFYIKIFFKIFPWRFLVDKHLFQKQKSQKNVLNCLVLLTLIFLGTLLDLLTFILFGLINTIYLHRKVYYQKLSKTHIKYSINLSHFAYVILHFLQLLVTVMLTIICWHEGTIAIKRLLLIDNISQLGGIQLQSLFVKVLIKIPYLICLLIIVCSYYKWKRRQFLINNIQKQLVGKSQKQINKIKRLNKQYKTFQAFLELLVDIFYLPLVMILIIIKIWKIKYYLKLINQQYQLQRTVITNLLSIYVKDLFLLLFVVILNLFILLLKPSSIKQNYYKAKQNFQINFKKQRQIQDNKNYNDQIIRSKIDSQLAILYQLSLNTLKNKINQIKTCIYQFVTISIPKFFYKNLTRYYKYSACKNKQRQDHYIKYYQKIENLDYKKNLTFWKHAYRIQRLRLIYRLLKVFLKQTSITKIQIILQKKQQYQNIQKQHQIQYKLVKALALKIIALVVEFILVIVGVVLLIPLTLWRLPTFICLMKIHKNKYYFFGIIKATYKQMGKDIILIPLKLVTICIYPFSYFNYIKQTSFQYGEGLPTFQKYQQSKQNFLIYKLFMHSLFSIIIHSQIVFIYSFWIRIKKLKYLLGKNRSIKNIYFNHIFINPVIPSIDIMINNLSEINYNTTYLTEIYNVVHQQFKETISDIPYLFVAFIVAVLMPWRIHHVKQALLLSRINIIHRKSLIKMLKSVFKDYLCVFVNLVLILSGFKTRKGITLIKRNFYFNFFAQGFETNYSYAKQLKNQFIALAFIYTDVFKLIIAIMFGWHRTQIIYKNLLNYYNKCRDEYQQQKKNEKIYKNTVKSGKQLNLLSKMGMFNYMKTCTFLSIPDIIKLRQVSKLHYQLTKREQVWFIKWQTLFSSKYNYEFQQFEQRCIKAYQQQNANHPIQITNYHSIIDKQFKRNVFQENIDINLVFKQISPDKYYKKIFKDYHFSSIQGYGPESQLPQSQDQDQEYLRLTQQTRRQKIQLQENIAYINILFYKPTEFITKKLTKLLRVDSYRRTKQIFVILISLLTLSFLITVLFHFIKDIIFLNDSFIGVRLLVLAYLSFLSLVIFQRFTHVYLQWVSLIPFNLVSDFFLVCRYIKTNIIQDKIYKPACKISQKIKNILYNVYLKVSAYFKKGAKFIIKYTNLFYQKVVKPLYIRIADIIRKGLGYVLTIFNAIKKSILLVLYSIKNIFSFIYKGIYSIFKNIDTLYFNLLKFSMNNLLKFGVIGNLLFTIQGLIIMTFPTLIWWFLYHEQWYLIVSTIHTMVLVVIGYKHLQKIKNNKQHSE